MPKPKLPSGERIYAIGDIHGRYDLFERLIGMIRDDSASRGQAHVRLVLLGDLIDRGPQSARLVHRCQEYASKSKDFIVLMGNHEQTMVEAMLGNYAALELWLQFGGDETLRSWGISDDILREGNLGHIMDSARSLVPRDVLRWLGALPLTFQRGGYLFVHAGIRPGVRLSRQAPGDLLWIRDGFLDSEADHQSVVVHGHSISDDAPDMRSNRIGIDTGAYRTGRLTALGLQEDEQWTVVADGLPQQAAMDIAL